MNRNKIIEKSRVDEIYWIISTQLIFDSDFRLRKIKIHFDFSSSTLRFHNKRIKNVNLMIWWELFSYAILSTRLGCQECAKWVESFVVIENKSNEHRWRENMRFECLWEFSYDSKVLTGRRKYLNWSNFPERKFPGNAWSSELFTFCWFFFSFCRLYEELRTSNLKSSSYNEQGKHFLNQKSTEI